MYKWFYKIYQSIQSHKTIAFLGMGLIILLFIFAASQLKFQEDVQQLIPKTEASERLQRILKTVEFTDKIIVNISTEKEDQEDSLVSYAKDLYAELQQSPNKKYIEKIQGNIQDREVQKTYQFILENLSLFLTDEDYKAIDQRLVTDSIKDRLEGAYKSLVSPSGFITKDFILNDPLQITSLGLAKLKSLELQSGFRIYNNFLVSEDGKNLLLLITPNQEYSDATTEMQPIGWSLRSFDALFSSEEFLFKNIIKRLKNGDVVLLHDNQEHTLKILERLLVFLKDNNFKSITVDELFKIKAYD